MEVAKMVVADAPLAIWERILIPGGEDITPEAACYLLRLDFTSADHARMEQLNEKAADGTLSPSEQRELDDYVRVGHQLARLQSTARTILRRLAAGAHG
jgi:hypothetical protein